VGALYRKLQTQSSVAEDGQYHRPKHVELIENYQYTITVASSRLFILFEINVLFKAVQTPEHAIFGLYFIYFVILIISPLCIDN
jgi:hypothetical protein